MLATLVLAGSVIPTGAFNKVRGVLEPKVFLPLVEADKRPPTPEVVLSTFPEPEIFFRKPCIALDVFTKQMGGKGPGQAKLGCAQHFPKDLVVFLRLKHLFGVASVKGPT